MSLDIGAVRTAMATALAALTTSPGFVVSAYAMAQPTPPGIQILPPACNFDHAMGRGMDEWTFQVQAFVALSTDIGSQKALDALCAPSGAASVKTLLEADRTLGGLVYDLRVIEQTAGHLVEAMGGSPYLTVEWTVQILASGK